VKSLVLTCIYRICEVCVTLSPRFLPLCLSRALFVIKLYFRRAAGDTLTPFRQRSHTRFPHATDMRRAGKVCPPSHVAHHPRALNRYCSAFHEEIKLFPHTYANLYFCQQYYWFHRWSKLHFGNNKLSPANLRICICQQIDYCLRLVPSSILPVVLLVSRMN
jgi:hypothetical protein